MTPPRRTAASTRELRRALIDHAYRLVAREGASALTMRALAAEAGCALGLPYKVFASRDELVSELIREEFRRLMDAFEEWIDGAGRGTVGGNLARYARLLLDSPAVTLAREMAHDAELSDAMNERAEESGVVAALEAAVTRYLAAERELGRVDRDVDVGAFGFLIAGAVHNLLVSGDAYPRPSVGRLERILEATAARLATSQPGES
ncbi:MAG: TetR/AcrR family transcriptional regulator [Gemmatimonadota bacterium]